MVVGRGGGWVGGEWTQKFGPPFLSDYPHSKIVPENVGNGGEGWEKTSQKIFQTYLAIYRAWRLKHIVRPTAVIIFIVFKSKTRDVPSDKWLWGEGVGGLVVSELKSLGPPSFRTAPTQKSFRKMSATGEKGEKKRSKNIFQTFWGIIGGLKLRFSELSGAQFFIVFLSI